MRRRLLGLLAIAALGVAVALRMFSSQDEWAHVAEANLVRAGVVMAVFWLAYNDLMRIPGWLWVALLPLLAVVVFKPKWLILAIPIVLLLAVLHPRVWAAHRKRRGNER
jgi:hypothetical protein